MEPHFLDLGTRWKSASRSGRFNPGEKASGTLWIGGWMDPMSGRRGELKILTPPGLELQPLGRPARSQSLYRLLYPDSYKDDSCRPQKVVRQLTEYGMETVPTLLPDGIVLRHTIWHETQQEYYRVRPN
jgi:hypothetical protein